jgi:hypothetical protein
MASPEIYEINHVEETKPILTDLLKSKATDNLPETHMPITH